MAYIPPQVQAFLQTLPDQNDEVNVEDILQASLSANRHDDTCHKWMEDHIEKLRASEHKLLRKEAYKISNFVDDCEKSYSLLTYVSTIVALFFVIAEGMTLKLN